MIELSKVLSSRWRELSEQDRVPFVERAKRFKIEYDDEVARYRQTDEYKQFLEQEAAWKKEHDPVDPVEDTDKRPKDQNGAY